MLAIARVVATAATLLNPQPQVQRVDFPNQASSNQDDIEATDGRHDHHHHHRKHWENPRNHWKNPRNHWKNDKNDRGYDRRWRV